MSISFILGNLLGRAAVTYLLIWLVWFCFTRFDWRKAFMRSKRWYSLLTLVLLTLGGMGAAVVHGGGFA